MTKVTVETYGVENVTRTLQSLPIRVRRELRTEIQRIAIDLQNKVKDEKLSGQVLNVKTGKLRRSIEQKVFDEDNGVTGVVWSRLGSPSYASFWEFGFNGEQTVKAHLREITQAFGKPVKEPRQITVGQHTRHVNQAPRSFLRSSLSEMKPDILERLDKAIGRVVK